MSDPINIRTLPPGTRIVTVDGAVAAVVSNPADGVWLFARVLEAPADPARVGQEDMIFAQDVVEVRPAPQSGGATMPEPQIADNAAQIAFWNSPAAHAWADQHARMDRALAPLLAALIDAAAPQPGERVLDIGCASGTTVLEWASRVGPGGHVLGADIAEHSVARARERIAAAGHRNAEVIVADAATHAFPSASFDLLCSRLGIMFFADPTAAFANIRRAVKPGGRAALVCFRTPAESPFPNAMTAAVRHLLPPLPTPGPEEPGPFSWADPARVHRILEGAGFREVSLAPVDSMIRIAGIGETDEAADFAMVFGPLARVLGELSPAQREAVRATLRDFFARHDGPDGIALPAAHWIVQARV